MYINTIHITCFDTSRGLVPVQAIPVPITSKYNVSLFRSSCRRRFIYGDDERILCLRGLFHVYAAGIYMCLFGNGYVRCVTLTNLNRDSLCTREQLTPRTISATTTIFYFYFNKIMNLFYISLSTSLSHSSVV